MKRTDIDIAVMSSEELVNARSTLSDWQAALKNIEITTGLEALHADMMIATANSMARINNALRNRQREFLSGGSGGRIHIVRRSGAAKLLGDDRRRLGSPGIGG